MKKRYTKPEMNIENFLMDMDIMSAISKEELDVWKLEYEEWCNSFPTPLNPKDENNWLQYKALMKLDFAYCYHTATLFS